jgi:hypothetical protein
MALFGSYAPPGVYTTVQIAGAGQPLFGNARIPVIIGEGQEFFEQDNVELFRGSTANSDEQVVNENISDQVVAITNEFHTTYFPVTDGSGKGVVSNDPSKVQIVVDGIPGTVISLDGATGDFTTQELVTPGQNVEISYFFQRIDTLVTNEDVSDQVPSFATLKIFDTDGNWSVISTSLPGITGNAVTISITDASLLSPPGPGVLDTQAVSGVGTDHISIEILKTTSSGSPPTQDKRTLEDIFNLVAAGIPTLDAGYLTATTPGGGSPPTLTPAVPIVATNLFGGLGPNTNKVFKVERVPIVDGTNGGVVTTDPTKVTVLVNGNKVSVSAVDGQTGYITLTNPVAFPSTVTITYWTNTYQNTFDLIPAQNVSEIVRVGLGPNRSDFVQDTDYVLGKDSYGNSIINWGASTTTAVGLASSGFTPFGPTQILTTLVDEHVYLRSCTGVSNGKNLVFSAPDAVTDGSGLSINTDDPTKISVYVGVNPVEALADGAVRVISLAGDTGKFTLYNAPLTGTNVYASYYRNALNDHTYTATVVNPGISGQGTYTLKDEVGRVLPVVSFDPAHSVVTQSGEFAQTGIVWPFAFPDLYDSPGEVDETVTLTFQDDGLTKDVNPGAQAYLNTQGLLFFVTTPGVGGDAITVAFNNTGTFGVVVTGNAIVFNGVTTTNQVVTLVGAGLTTTFGTVLVQLLTAGSVSTAAPLNLAGGVDPTTPEPYAIRYLVTSSSPKGSSGQGYLDQTYIDQDTGLKFTIVAPADALSYGYQSLPTPQYTFQPGDTLVFVVSSEQARFTGATYVPFSEAQQNNLIAIAGLHTEVVTTYGANAGDTALIQTFNKSGNEPLVGEYYYISFQTTKQPSDFAIKMYTKATDAYNAYGQPSTINRVSLGIQLMTQNGAQQFGVVQVPKQPGLNTATDASFIAAIQTLTTALPGLNTKANVIVPLSTSTTVQQFLSRQLITQAGPRNKGEAIGFVGYSTFTGFQQAIANAQSLKSSRMIAIGMPAAGILITNTQTGQQQEYSVDGSFIAAAMAGLNINPSNDVATTLTNQNLTGFSRLLVQYDDTVMDQMAAAGLVALTNNNGALNIRHYKSTDPSNPITSEPTCTTITDYVCQQFRADFKQFIGRKLVTGLLNDITIVGNSRLTSLSNNQIIAGYNPPNVAQDPTDPTTVDVTITFKPMFSLLYISVTFTVTTTL